MGLSVGIGLTNDCNLHCAHCYRDTHSVDHISQAQIKLIGKNLPMAAMGFGTGESALNPEFISIVEYLHGQRVKTSFASNGYTLMALSDDHLLAFHDVELSLDFPSREEQDAFRGDGNWNLLHRAMERCRALGVPFSLLATMMNVNFDKMDALVGLAREQGATLRVNAYQSVKTDRFALSFEQFWEGYRQIFAGAKVVSCSEPVVRAALGLDEVRSPCGHTSIRINQRGEIVPCVYWPAQNRPFTITDLADGVQRVLESDEFQRARRIPPSASDCRCQGGCASRRALGGEIDAHDAYCPWVRGQEIRLDWQPAPGVDLMRAGNVCTTIVAP